MHDGDGGTEHSVIISLSLIRIDTYIQWRYLLMSRQVSDEQVLGRVLRALLQSFRLMVHRYQGR